MLTYEAAVGEVLWSQLGAGSCQAGQPVARQLVAAAQVAEVEGVAGVAHQGRKPAVCDVQTAGQAHPGQPARFGCRQVPA